MQEDINPYDPPESPIEIKTEGTTEAYFFTTSNFKLAVMSICTLGIYELYLFL